ncbi:MAG TPA: glutathione S-transferase family protein [Beijerinckiaceae bacterium]|nr:glutathione S-transferase family protein [Beijerinckiaceae bacterium]
MLKVWGRTNSLNVQKVLLCLEELEIAYDRVDAGMEFGIVKTPEYKALNPNSRVPTLDDDGFILWESNVIVRYLCAKYADGTLSPADLRTRADADRWMDWQQTTFNPDMNPIFVTLVRKSRACDDETIEKLRLASERNAAIVDALLARRPFISGNIFGMADLVLAPPLHRWLNLPVERSPGPKLDRWYDALMTRPAAKKVLTLPIA